MIGPTQLLIILAIILVLFGGAFLPRLTRSFGEFFRNFKDETKKDRTLDKPGDDEDSRHGKP